MQTLIKEKARVAIALSGNRDNRTRTSTRDKEGHFIMIKGSIHQEDMPP